MRVVLTYIFFIFLSLNLSAKQREQSAEFTGVGQVKSKPDFIQVSFTVQSECYGTPSDAQSATDEVVKKIDEYLQQLKVEGDEHFKILVDGGYTTNFSKWYKDRELCRNTFQKTTDVSVKIGATEGFDKIFSELQSYALKNFEMGFANDFFDSSRTYVRINAPVPQVTPKHRLELERTAIHLAMLDAKARFRASMQSCKSHPWKVLRMKEDEQGYVAPRSYHVRAAKMMASSVAEMADAAPVRFDDLTVEKRLSVTFEFEGAMCYEP